MAIEWHSSHYCSLRAAYNRHGKKSADQMDGEMMDAGAMFSQMFGGASFHDWVGEIALGKELQKAMDISMTDEEREEIKRELAKEDGASNETADLSSLSTKSTGGTAAAGHPASEAHPAHAAPASLGVYTPGSTTPGAQTPLKERPTASGSATPTSGSSTDVHRPSGTSTPTSGTHKPGKLSAEQRAQLQALDAQRDKERVERVKNLAQKLKDRCRAFEQATRPGDAAGSSKSES